MPRKTTSPATPPAAAPDAEHDTVAAAPDAEHDTSEAAPDEPDDPIGDFSLTLPVKAINALIAHASRDAYLLHLRCVYVHPSGYGWATDGHRALLVGPGLPSTMAAAVKHEGGSIPICWSDLLPVAKVAGVAGTVELRRVGDDISATAFGRKGDKVGHWPITPESGVSEPPIARVMADCDARIGESAPPAAPMVGASPAYIVAACEAMTAIGARTMRLHVGPEPLDPIMVRGDNPDAAYRAIAVVMPMRT
jgi:hypothetical protein